MPRYPIDRSTNFIVEEESWTVVEYDHTSVPGVIYLSLTEGKINSIYDDLENNIADTDKIADYQLLLPNERQAFAVGDDIVDKLKFTLTKNGVPSDEPINVLTTNKKYARFDKTTKRLVAAAEGEVELVLQLKNYPSITQHVVITIGEVNEQFSGYIEGESSIRLDRKTSYTLKGTLPVTGEVSYHLNDNGLAAIEPTVEPNVCIVHANAKNLP